MKELTNQLLVAVKEQDVLAVLHFAELMKEKDCLREGLQTTDVSNGLSPLFATIDTPLFPLREISLSILLLKSDLSPTEKMIEYAKESGNDEAVNFLSSWETVGKEDAEDAEMLRSLPPSEAAEWIQQHLPPPPNSVNPTRFSFDDSPILAASPVPFPSPLPIPTHTPLSPITSRSAASPPPESTNLFDRIGPVENRPPSSFLPSSQLIRSLTRNTIRSIRLPSTPSIPLPSSVPPLETQVKNNSTLKISRLPEFFNHNHLIETLECINIEAKVLSYSIADHDRHALISVPLISRDSVILFLSNRFIENVPLLVQIISPVSYHPLPQKPQVVSPVLEIPSPNSQRSRSRSRSRSSSARPQCPPSFLPPPPPPENKSTVQAPLYQRVGPVARPRIAPRKGSYDRSGNENRRHYSSSSSSSSRRR